ncbi:hypothetical protein [Microvirga sp. TS319]|uniref:hypothetical protein n=1 Tax=Microvirga sp. TS319 TaxID=3241165 RepID=UPI00351A4711
MRLALTTTVRSLSVFTEQETIYSIGREVDLTPDALSLCFEHLFTQNRFPLLRPMLSLLEHLSTQNRFPLLRPML